jgi:hypothetical protein
MPVHPYYIVDDHKIVRGRQKCCRRKGVRVKKLGMSLAVAVAVILFAGQRASASSCPAVGLDTDCGVILTVGPGGSVSLVATGQPLFFDPIGQDDVLVGLVNDSGAPLTSLFLTGNGIFAFDGDGMCNLGYGVPGCPYDSTQYAGPDNTFSGYNSAGNFGFVNFTTPIPNGGTTYFSLENLPSPSSSIPEPASLLLFGTGLSGLGGLMRRKRGQRS